MPPYTLYKRKCLLPGARLCIGLNSLPEFDDRLRTAFYATIHTVQTEVLAARCSVLRRPE